MALGVAAVIIIAVVVRVKVLPKLKKVFKTAPTSFTGWLRRRH